MLRQLGVRNLFLGVGFAGVFLLWSGVARGDSLFYGSYAVENWTLTLGNGKGVSGGVNGGYDTQGGVDTTSAPASVTIIGSDNSCGCIDGGFSGGNLFSITVPTTTTLRFYWTYTTFDITAFWDPAGYEVNGVHYYLYTSSPLDWWTDRSGSGETTVSLTAGDQFGFWVSTVDDFGGLATLTVTAAPEPSSFALLAAGLLGLAGLFTRGSRQLG